MTEKKQRFYLLSDKEDAIIFENGFGLSQQKACDLLNALHEENQRLKKERNHFERKKTEYLTEWNTCRIQNTELKKDNQELKEAMKRMAIEMMGG